MGNFGNPTSLYKKGREAAAAVEGARKTIAGLIGAKAGEIVFTAGGTESNNLAIFGVARNFKPAQAHLITSAIEHHSVIRPFEALAGEGYSASYVKVNEQGFVNLAELKKAVRPETVLISIMLANNEIGTIQPIAEIGKWLKALNRQRLQKKLPRVIFHTDACQGAGALNLNVSALGVDLMTINASKIYGPKQTGLLFVRSGVNIKPLIYGGGQEKELRSGTENVPGIVGLARAFELAQKNRVGENKRLKKLRDYFIGSLLKKLPNVILNGPDERGRLVAGEALKRLPNNINISISGILGEDLLLYLDSYNISVSTGSACTSTSQDPSHVILALGRKPEYLNGSMRFTLGKQTTKRDLDYVLKVLPGIVAELRRMAK